ncbi:MAG TPA: hypothetical protein DDW91_08505, partial [Shewanella frigidimarina]|nr:hypothetical protein [Shewanella frigidimarina]
EGSLGKHTQYFREREGKISLADARQQFLKTPVSQGSSNSISLGIDVDPVWMTFTINNTSTVS